MKPQYISNISLNEAIWRNHYQLVVSAKEDKDAANPLFYGSAFCFIYEGHHWLITADHVVHPDKHGKDKQKVKEDNEYSYSLINNISNKKELFSINTPLTGFYFFDEFVDLTKEFTDSELKELGVTIDDFFQRIDVAFCDITKGTLAPCFTHELCESNGGIIVKAGLPKLQLMVENVSEPNPQKKYFDYGVIDNKVQGCFLLRSNATQGFLKYVGQEDGLYKFKPTIDPVSLEQWAALSGSAMFDEDGNVVGMSIRVSEDTDIVWVVPMHLIMRLIRYAVEYEKSQKKLLIEPVSKSKKSCLHVNTTRKNDFTYMYENYC